MRFEFDTFTAQGPRPENQDATFSLILGEIAIFGIADGMGGKAGGKIAADLAVSTACTLLGDRPDRDLSEVFSGARDALLERAASDAALRNMGTTLSICRIIGSEAEIGHVGDTRVFHLRDQGILRRTEDQTEVEELVRQGILTKTKARTYHRKNILLSAISTKSDYSLFRAKFDVRPNDWLVLSTDGLHSVVLTREIAAIAAKASHPSQLCQMLEDAVKERGAEDNYTAMCVEVLQ